MIVYILIILIVCIAPSSVSLCRITSFLCTLTSIDSNWFIKGSHAVLRVRLSTSSSGPVVVIMSKLFLLSSSWPLGCHSALFGFLLLVTFLVVDGACIFEYVGPAKLMSDCGKLYFIID